MRSIRGAQIAMVFQDPMTSLNPVYTVGFQISEALMLHQDMDKKEAYERSKIRRIIDNGRYPGSPAAVG
jgi:ABC-type microcin C transport system duplicated ATPase subunit YejF